MHEVKIGSSTERKVYGFSLNVSLPTDLIISGLRLEGALSAGCVISTPMETALVGGGSPDSGTVFEGSSFPSAVPSSSKRGRLA